MTKMNKKKRATQIDRLVQEVRYLRAEIRKSAATVSEQIEGSSILGTKRAMGGFGVITDIYFHGPQTIPQLLEQRDYTRQNLHDVVKQLEAEGLVEFLENPNHKRSMLVSATEKGVRHMMERRKIVMKTVVPLTANVSDEDFETAMDVLHKLRGAWKELNS